MDTCKVIKMIVYTFEFQYNVSDIDIKKQIRAYIKKEVKIPKNTRKYYYKNSYNCNCNNNNIVKCNMLILRYTKKRITDRMYFSDPN